jgi:hypothetical protein
MKALHIVCCQGDFGGVLFSLGIFAGKNKFYGFVLEELT